MSCRDTFGLFEANSFKFWTCSMCYYYLFPKNTALRPNWPSLSLISMNGTVFPHGMAVVPDIDNVTSLDLVCRTLSGDSCRRWTTCCEDAWKCCTKQQTSTGLAGNGYCPHTWDGFACWDDTPVGHRVHTSCPEYVEHFNPSIDAYKDCTADGSWWKDPNSNREWTNYTMCVSLENFRSSIYIGIACNVISIVLLIPAIAIFVYFRQLRGQKRIRLHICLFASFVLSSFMNLLWDSIVYMDRLDNIREETIMHQSSPGCKLLYVLVRYARSTNFFWMFCEGLYLHRLIANTFDNPKTLIPYYICGWGVAALPVAVYSIIRVTLFNESCWVMHAGGFEWIMYIPSLLCILINLIFLCNILRILLTKLQSHPNEPSNYRRALKATFVLVPLFGLQLFLVIYRPPPGSGFARGYDIVSNIVTKCQGAIIALIFCFFNGEVHTYIKNFCRRLSGVESMRETSRSQSTHYTIDRESSRKGDLDQSYIPLNTIQDDITSPKT